MSELKIAESTICVIGLKKRQNELLTSFLERETAATCVAGDSNFDIPQRRRELARKPRLILWDCQEGGTECLLEFESRGEAIANEDYVVFINVRSGLGIEEEAIDLGVRGFFYESDPLDKLPKCLQATLDGELWVSRKILANAVLSKRSLITRSSRKASEFLSPREIEILRFIMIGATNREIAEKLYISPHTVKSHAYNIYSKINVPNRLQAILWAMANL
ncbi:MAG: response regulator transcription factor [Deltaproteobacteria bacterium]|nr:response regulator transcription factor [Deltaproteobacteria bacterium]